ncbi:unnamed protein product [Rotaria sp. Silwood1]|nr:unnamed protein product [Rotaria sp. Silwood1]
MIYIKYSINNNILPSERRSSQSVNDNRIPSIVHFVIGQGDKDDIRHRYQRSTPFSFINYLTFLAASRHLRPKKFFVHYYYEPNSFWWNKTKLDPEINITLIKRRQVKEIFKKNVDHHAHRGDIMRLEVLIEYGGIYLDSDVLTLRSFVPLLNLNDVVMAHQDDQEAACNAVILAKKDATFLKRLYDAYQSFDQNCWDCHSVRLPGRLASIYPNEITVLPTNTFFRPSWNEKEALYESNNYNFTPNYACHLWNKINNHNYLSRLTPEVALSANNTFGRMLRHAIGNATLIKLKQFFSS